jgi:hypothetical protein
MSSQNLVETRHLLFVALYLFLIDLSAVLKLTDHDALLEVVEVEQLNESAFGDAGLDDAVEVVVLVEGVGEEGYLEEYFVVGSGEVEELVGEVAVVLVGVDGQVYFEQSLAGPALFEELVENEQHLLHLSEASTPFYAV